MLMTNGTGVELGLRGQLARAMDMDMDMVDTREGKPGELASSGERQASTYLCCSGARSAPVTR